MFCLERSVKLLFLPDFNKTDTKQKVVKNKFLMLKSSCRRLKVRIVFMGSPEFAVPSLQHLVLNQYKVVAVYTQPDKPGGRGRSLVSPPVKRAALTWNLKVMQPASLKGEEVVGQLSDFQPDILVLAAYGQILPQSVLDIPTYGCVNVHPSLLPRFRGASPVAAAILAGDEFTGVTIMLMDEGLDTGPILARAQIPVSAQDTTASLSAKLSMVAARLLQEVLVHWSRGELTARPQDEAEATYSSLFSKEEGEIDWHLPAVELWRRVRAFYPWPGCFSRWQGRQFKIIETVPLPHEENVMEAGQVVIPTPTREGANTAFGVCTGDGILGVSKVQLEGKQVMPAAEFLRGQRRFVGTVLPSIKSR